MLFNSVWRKTGIGTGLNEKCVRNEAGDYVGIKTGTLYPNDTHYHSEYVKAQIVAVDDQNNTGMMHHNAGWTDNSETNNKRFKKNFIGCFVTVRKSHNYGETKVYYCAELSEYFSDQEIKIL